MSTSSELRSQLAKQKIKELERSNDELQSTVKDLRATLQGFRHLQSKATTYVGRPKPSVPSFLKIIPTEIRLKIYRYLLVNPQLGEVMWIGTNTNYGASFKYELSPNVLRTCQAIYDEAVSILYEINTFVFVCHRRKENSELISDLPQSPLTRYIDQDRCPFKAKGHPSGENYNDFNIDEIPNLKAIKRWNVITAVFEYNTVSMVFADLCQAVCDSRLKDFKLALLLPKAQPPSPSRQEQKSHEHIHTIGDTLSILRNVENASFEIAQRSSSDLPPGMSYWHYYWGYSAKDFAISLRQRYVTTIKGNTPLEKVSQMYQLLLIYAKTFERNSQFKVEMDPDYPKFRKGGEGYEPLLPDNPFRPYSGEDTWHEVERLLKTIRKLSRVQGIASFKVERMRIFDILEPQYKRITQSMRKLHSHIMAEKSFMGLFDKDIADGPSLEETCEKSMEVLEDAAKAFDRDLCWETKLLVRQNPTKYRLTKEDLPREKWLAKMGSLFVVSFDECLDVDEFIVYFKLAADDMQQQYMEIREARKNLLSLDVTKPGIHVPTSIEKHLEEPIDWTTDPSMFAYDESKFN